jgi:aldehyde:ferredoxin oxidoreductase
MVLGRIRTVQTSGSGKWTTTIEGKPREMIIMQDIIASAMNSLGLCYFTYGQTNSIGYVPDFLEAVTGHKMGIEALLLCGERSFNVKRAFNAREGMGRKDDVLPHRFTHQALQQGISKASSPGCQR